jgi:AcrR family transcriptional regulator
MKLHATRRLPAVARRRTILEAALGLLAKEGYAGMTTASVARTAGVAEPILYRHFSSKRVMLRALLDEVVTRMMAAFEELIQGEVDPVTALRKICLGYPVLSRRYREEFRIVNQTLVHVNDRTTRLLLVRHYESYHAFLQNLIERGQQNGTLRKDIPASVGAWHMIHSALGFLMTQNLRGEAQSRRDAQKLAEATLSGLISK